MIVNIFCFVPASDHEIEQMMWEEEENSELEERQDVEVSVEGGELGLLQEAEFGGLVGLQ